MRDIRPDLQERVDEIDAELARLDHRSESLRQIRGYYAGLIESEGLRWSKLAVSAPRSNNGHVPTPTPTEARRDRERTPLARFIIESLADHQPHSEKEVAELAVARGFPFGAKNPLKVVHFAMMGMGQGNKLEKLDKTVWRLPATPEATAEEDSDRGE